jgi:hypothetical protein
MERLKAGKLAVEIKLGQQELLQPFVPFKFNISTPQGFHDFSTKLIQAAMEHRIDMRVGGFINGVVRNWISYNQPEPAPTIAPPQVNINVRMILGVLDKILPTLEEAKQIEFARAVKVIEASAANT